MKSKHGLLLGVMAAVGLYALASVAQTNTSVKVASAGIASDIDYVDGEVELAAQRSQRGEHFIAQVAVAASVECKAQRRGGGVGRAHGRLTCRSGP